MHIYNISIIFNLFILIILAYILHPHKNIINLFCYCYNIESLVIFIMLLKKHNSLIYIYIFNNICLIEYYLCLCYKINIY